MSVGRHEELIRGKQMVKIIEMKFTTLKILLVIAWISYSHQESEDLEQTLVLLKPDAVARGLVYEKVPVEMLHEHYKEHVGKHFFNELVESMTAGPIVAIQLRGENVVARVRKMLGATDPSKADVGTLRQKYGLSKTRNFMHASDSSESAAREAALWLPAEDGSCTSARTAA